MASPGQLVALVAETTGLSRATVEWHDRNLVKAGLRSKSGRGSSAAKVTARDAAHLLVALLASDQTQQSVMSVQRYRETAPHRDTSTKNYFAGSGISELTMLPEAHSFVDAVEALIAAVVGRTAATHAPLIELTALSPGTVGDVRLAGLPDGAIIHVRYAPPTPWTGKGSPPPAAIARWEATLRVDRRGDFERLGRITERTIRALGQALAPKTEESKR